jgi:hypothetical protein
VTSLHLGQSRVCSVKRPPALDYAAFQKEIEEKFKNFDSNCFSICEVDTKISQMQLLFKESISAANKKPRKNNKGFLPPEIMTEIKIRKTLLKNRDQCHNSDQKQRWNQFYNHSNRKVKQMLKCHKKNELETQIFKMAEKSDNKKMWQMVNSFCDSNSDIPSPLLPLVRQDGKKTKNIDEKCQVFAASLQEIHQTPKDLLFDQEWRDRVNNFVNTNQDLFQVKHKDRYEPNLPPISAAVLRNTLRSTKSARYRVKMESPTICSHTALMKSFLSCL